MKESYTFVKCLQDAFGAVDPEVSSRVFAAYLEATRAQLWADETTMKAIDESYGELESRWKQRGRKIDILNKANAQLEKRNDELYAKCGEHHDRAKRIATTILTRLHDHPNTRAWKAILDINFASVDRPIKDGQYNDAARLINELFLLDVDDLSMALEAVHARKKHLARKSLPKALRKFIERNKDATNTTYDGFEFWYVPYGCTDPEVLDDFPILEELTHAEPDVWHQVKTPYRVGCQVGIGWYRKMTNDEFDQHIPF